MIRKLWSSATTQPHNLYNHLSSRLVLRSSIIGNNHHSSLFNHSKQFISTINNNLNIKNNYYADNIAIINHQKHHFSKHQKSKQTNDDDDDDNAKNMDSNKKKSRRHSKTLSDHFWFLGKDSKNEDAILGEIARTVLEYDDSGNDAEYKACIHELIASMFVEEEKKKKNIDDEDDDDDNDDDDVDEDEEKYPNNPIDDIVQAIVDKESNASIKKIVQDKFKQNESNNKNKSDQHNPKKWMNAIDDNTRIVELVIPGSHESAAMHPRNYGPWELYGLCQNKNILEQLEAGIRYFDLRVVPKHNQLQMYHGKYSQGSVYEGKFDSKHADGMPQIQKAIEAQMIEFLDKNKSECIIVKMKNEASDTPKIGNGVDHSKAKTEIPELLKERIERKWYYYYDEKNNDADDDDDEENSEDDTISVLNQKKQKKKKKKKQKTKEKRNMSQIHDLTLGKCRGKILLFTEKVDQNVVLQQLDGKKTIKNPQKIKDDKWMDKPWTNQGRHTRKKAWKDSIFENNDNKWMYQHGLNNNSIWSDQLTAGKELSKYDTRDHSKNNGRPLEWAMEMNEYAMKEVNHEHLPIGNLGMRGRRGGVITMDFVDDKLPMQIVQHNFKGFINLEWTGHKLESYKSELWRKYQREIENQQNKSGKSAKK